MRLLEITSGFAAVLKQHGLRAALHAVMDRVYVRWFEWRLGIRSESVIELKQLGIENEFCRPYAPTDYRSFIKMLDELRIEPGKESFLDFGSGLGRAVVLAATRPFRRVLGVEIAPQLNQAAWQNIHRALPRLMCRDIELFTCDATEFKIPKDVTMIYFYNPFAGKVLALVLANIRKSFQLHPRLLRLVCKMPAISAFEEEIKAHDWLVQERELLFHLNSRYLVFVAARHQQVERFFC